MRMQYNACETVMTSCRSVVYENNIAISSAVFSAALPKDSFHAIGRSGQFVTIIPLRELVIVRLGLTRKADAWQHDSFIQMVFRCNLI